MSRTPSGWLCRICCHDEKMLVPGLLQSRGYIEAIVLAGGFEFPEALVARRLERQRLLTGPAAPRYEVVVDARALLYRPGDLDVTVDQLDHLVDRAMLPAVQLRIVPLQTGRAALSMTPFMIFDSAARRRPRWCWSRPTRSTCTTARPPISRHTATGSRGCSRTRSIRWTHWTTWPTCAESWTHPSTCDGTTGLSAESDPRIQSNRKCG